MTPSFFLRAKHWQIFVALVVAAIFAAIVMGILMATMFASIQNQILGHSDAVISPETFSWIFYVMPFLVITAAAPQLLWMWHSVVSLSKFIRPAEKMPRVGLFKVTMIALLLLLAYLPVHIFGFVTDVITEGENITPGRVIGFVLSMLLFQMIALFCALNNTYAVAKTIKMAELQRRVRFGDFVGDFFFILFLFPVAIWFIQPRINKAIEVDNTENDLQRTEDLLDA